MVRHRATGRTDGLSGIAGGTLVNVIGHPIAVVIANARWNGVRRWFHCACLGRLHLAPHATEHQGTSRHHEKAIHGRGYFLGCSIVPVQPFAPHLQAHSFFTLAVCGSSRVMP